MLISYSIILGLIQGATEFLPISSSAHLVITSLFLKQPYQGLTFDITLHIGTLFALFLYFFRDWLVLLKKGFVAPKSSEGKLLWYILLASIPAAAAGFTLETIAETIFRNPLIIALALISGAVILWISDRKATLKNDIRNIGIKESFFIGAAQALAIIPGVSRSGITIAAGLLTGLKREAAAKFSFFLAAPVIFGAGLLRITKLKISDFNSGFIIGILSSAIAGLLSINFLMKYLRKSNLNIFVFYRVLLAIIILLTLVKTN